MCYLHDTPNYYKKTFYIFFQPSIRMNGNSKKFEDKKMRTRIYKNKKLFNIHDLDISKILVSKKESYGKKNSLKCFIQYNDDDVTRPLCIKLPQMIGYVKNFDSNKTMPLKVNDNKL